MQLENKTALVLGASRHLGRAMAMALGREGARLVLPYFDWPDSVAEMEEDLAAAGFAHLTLAVDLRDEAQVTEMAARIKKEYGGLDILVNNIERGGMPLVHGPYTPEQWELELATTITAKHLVFSHCLPLLQRRTGAAVINISSIAGLTGRSGPAGLIFGDAYSAANRAVSSFTETWARQAAPEVRVNEIMLGLFAHRHGEGTRGWPLLTAEQQHELIDHTLLGRTGQADDLVKAMLFLIKDAPFMTGATLRLDGGYVLGGAEVPPMPAGLTEDLAIKLG
ncbi:MAG: SDR family oxidoreductase [Thermodesulfobacteriota bacterium]